MNIYQKKMQVMKKVSKLFKDLRVKYKETDYRGISEEEVLKTVRPILIETGIDISITEIEQMDSYNPNRLRCKYTIKWTNIDEPTDFIITQVVGDGQDKGDKAPGKANTYALKYALLKNLLIMTGDDPDYMSSEELVDKMKSGRASKYIPEKEVDRLLTIAEEGGLDTMKFGGFIKTALMTKGQMSIKVRELVRDSKKLWEYLGKAKEKLGYDTTAYYEVLRQWGEEL